MPRPFVAVPPVAVPPAVVLFALLFAGPAASAGCGGPGSAPCGPDYVPPILRRILIPQVGLGADFRPACAQHDRCYTVGYRDRYGRRTTRLQCDRQFLGNLDRACDSALLPGLCRLRARGDYLAVRIYGAVSFDTP